MFASIAGRYDLLNHLLSLNIDRSWRRFTTRDVPPVPGVPVLDCCTGTADLALAYHRAGRGRSAPWSAPTSAARCSRSATARSARPGPTEHVSLIEGDTHRLPLPADTFGVVTVAFGLRNVADTVGGIDEMIRVARPGGKVAVLEFSRPRGAILGRLYLLFFRRILPRVGQALAPNRDDAYRYLPASVLQFPDGQAMLDLMAARGLTDLKHVPSDVRHRHALRRDQAAAMNPARSDEAPPLVLALTGASGAPYAVRLLRILGRAGRTVHLTISPSAVEVLREETDLAIDLSPARFDPALLRRPRPRPAGLSPPRRLLRRDRQRLVPDGRHGRLPLQHEHPRRDRPRHHHEPDHPRGRRPPEGASQADPRARARPR